MKRLLSLLCLLGIMFALQMKLLADPPLYMVVYDLDKTEWKVRYTNDGPDLDDDTCRTTELWLRCIPAGTFIMGSPEGELGRSDDETQHKVTLTKPFYIGVFECTQKQWELVKGTRLSYFKNDAYYATRPVEMVSYGMIRGSTENNGIDWPTTEYAVAESSFMGHLRAKTGLTFDLPTEAQWEYACRAGTTTALNSGKDLISIHRIDANMAEVGRYYHNGGSRYSTNCNTTEATAKVGSYKPNNWGLYDMHGNVLEWCLDWCDYIPYDASPVVDPVGDEAGLGRVARGGGWDRFADCCRSAVRDYYDPSNRSYVIGFRVLCLMPYSVTVVDGTADKTEAAEGETVTITADEPAADEVFDKWVGDGVTFADVTAEQTSFVMPAAAVTVTATYKAKVAAEYTVTVVNGVADKATAAKGDIVTITADDRFPSHKLLRWTTATSGVKFADKLSAETTFVMPAKDVTVKATYQVLPRYTVKVTNGTADKAQAYAGETVTITAAEPPAKKQFYKWTCTGLTFEDANVVQTTFVMPKKSVWVKANYTAAP